MLDNQLYILVRQLLTVQAPTRGLVDVQYPQRYQPTQQGRNTERTVYLHKVSDTRIGSAQVEQRFIGGATVQRVETQSMETILQFSVTQPAAMDDDELTHDDVLKIVAATLQSQDSQSFLVANAASILRVRDIRNTFVQNDRHQFEPSPTFDAVFKHNDVFIDGVPYINTFTFEVHAVPSIA